ncbi:MAG: hypothetical protein ACOC00_00070 [Halothiobacillaceae bacterium]
MLQALPEPRSHDPGTHPQLWDAYADAYADMVLRRIQETGEQTRRDLTEGIEPGEGCSGAQHRQFVYTALFVLLRTGRIACRCTSERGQVIELFRLPGV